MERIRIAHIAGGLTTGGVESVIYNYFSYMDRSRYELVYISYDTPDPQVARRFRDLGFTVYAVTKKKDHFFRSCAEVYRILRRHRIQIVHSHMTLMCFVTNLLGRLAGARVLISHSHLVVYPTGLRRPLYALFKFLSRVTATDWFACGEDAGVYLFGRRAFDRGRVRLLYNAIDLDDYRCSEDQALRARAAAGLEGAVVVGNVGRFTEQKNQLFALEVFRAFRKRRPDSRLLLVGSGPMLQQVRDRAAELGLSDAVLFPGSDPQPAKYYRLMDVFLFPSTYEGLGIVALEAQAASLPVLASDAVPREAAVSGHMRFLSLDASAEAWARALEQLLPERARMRTEQQALRRAMEARHLEIGQEAVRLDGYYRSRLGRS